MIRFQVRKVGPGRPTPGTVAEVIVRPIDPHTAREQDPVVLDSFIGSGRRGGLDPAEDLAQCLNDAWNAWRRGSVPESKLPSDTEVLAMARARILNLEESIHNMLETFKETGSLREEAISHLKTVDNELVQGFLKVYMRTVETRTRSLMRLFNSMQQDYRTAVLLCNDATDEERARLLGLSDTPTS